MKESFISVARGQCEPTAGERGLRTALEAAVHERRTLSHRMLAMLISYVGSQCA